MRAIRYGAELVERRGLYIHSRNPLCVQLDMEQQKRLQIKPLLIKSQSAMRAIRYGVQKGTS